MMQFFRVVMIAWFSFAVLNLGACNRKTENPSSQGEVARTQISKKPSRNIIDLSGDFGMQLFVLNSFKLVPSKKGKTEKRSFARKAS